MTDSIVTQGSTESPGIVWRHCSDPLLPFDPIVFDEAELARQQLITGQAGAGRGNTFFFSWQGQPLVLRHYRRGGLAQKLSRRHYLYTGLERTRAMREFDMLVELCHLPLPVSRPYACRVQRRGLFYQASLVTHWLAGRTLAESISGNTADETLTSDTWEKLGDLIARMHAAGVFHADLNAHNIMIDGPTLSLIDFDRAQYRALPAGDAANGWCLSNIERLLRSLQKLAPDEDAMTRGFALLEAQWRNSLNQSISPRS